MARRTALGICLMTLLAIVAFAPARAMANAPCTKVTFENVFNHGRSGAGHAVGGPGAERPESSGDVTTWTDVNTYPGALRQSLCLT